MTKSEKNKEKIIQIEVLPSGGFWSTYQSGFLAVTNLGNIYLANAKVNKWQKIILPEELQPKQPHD